MSRNLDEQFWTMRKGPSWNATAPYNTRKQAIDDGAVILCYGYVTILYPLPLSSYRDDDGDEYL